MRERTLPTTAFGRQSPQNPETRVIVSRNVLAATEKPGG